MAYLIALSDGHGMSTAGKRTPVFTDGTKSKDTGKNFMHENEFNRAVVKYVDEGLRASGFNTLLVAPTDADTSLTARTNLAKAKGADIYVSVHANALTGKWGSANGIETLVYPSGDSLKLGKILHSQVMQGTQMRDRGVKDGSGLWEIRGTAMPAVLLELGFMDNDREARLLMSEAYRKECAAEIVKGICEFYGVAYKGTTAARVPSETDVKVSETSTVDTGKGTGLVKVTTDVLPLRTKPDAYADKVKDVVRNGVYYVYAEKEGWFDLGGGVWGYGGGGRLEYTEHPKKYYRVRKTWEDATSQKGAFVSFAMSKAEADKHAGYNVFDESGRNVHVSTKK